MKTKKFVTSVTVLALATIVLGGCGSDEQKASTASSSQATTEMTTDSQTGTENVAESTVVLQDGTYKLEEKNYNNGYRAVFSIEVKDGKIVASNYDNVNEEGKSKQEDTEYNKMMQDKAGNSPEKFIPAFNEALVANQDPSAIEVVSGATHSFHAFQNYAQQLIQAAQAGDTKTIEIDNGAELKDGTYTIEEKNYNNGYRVAFSIEVKDGKVVASNYDNINEAGKSKQEDVDYNKMMQDKAGNSPEKFIPAFNEALVDQMAKEEGTPGDIEVVSGATHSFHTFILYTEQLINAAEKGDTATITVDNFVEAK
jgi:Major membrane immunogen, membrane-anchored lipoprotein